MLLVCLAVGVAGPDTKDDALEPLYSFSIPLFTFSNINKFVS